jgi:hypothetical protein
MPHPLVRTERDEYLWQRAKEIVTQEYGLTEEDGDRYWRLVMGIFLRMKRLRKRARALKVLVKEVRWLTKAIKDVVATLSDATD